MLDRCEGTLLFGCLVVLVLSSAVDAGGRVFVPDLRNSSGLRGFRDAERACASHQARLASAEELRHAVMECFFSPCTRGWLHGGTVGSTVCNVVGSELKAMDVRTENGTEDTAHLDAFCIRDKGVPCGDPPSFPHARLQGHSGFEMGDELLYTCVPGYAMPGGHGAFSLLCDSCGEWYGLVQICVKDGTESHIDYEDKFIDSYEEEEEEDHGQRAEEAHGQVYEEVHDRRRSQDQQETSFGLVEDQEQHAQREEEGGDGMGVKSGGVEGGEKEEERAAEDFTRRREQERREEVRVDGAAATEAPVSVLSQKHMFWFPSEAFQEEGRPVTPRESGGHSEESREQEEHPEEEQEEEPESYDHPHDGDGHEDHEDHGDSHHDDDDVKRYVPAQHDDLDRRDRHDDHDDHYDMGEHEDGRVRYGGQVYDDRDDAYDERDKTAEDREHPEDSKENPDREGHDGDDGVGHDHHDRHHDHDDDRGGLDHDREDHDSQDSHHDHDSHEDDDEDEGRQHVTFSVGTDRKQNVTEKEAGSKSTTDDTWLDGYPVVIEDAQNGGSPTDRPNDEVPPSSSPEERESLTVDPEKGGVKDDLTPTATPSPDSPSYPDTLDYDTQEAAPTHPWQEDLTEHPFLLDHGPAPPVHYLPGEVGERGEMEGEMGETICVGEDCPPRPPGSSGHGPTVTAIIVAVCALAAAAVVGVWCYRRQQQKSSMYEMNGKGKGHSRQEQQQIEMQQKV